MTQTPSVSRRTLLKSAAAAAAVAVADAGDTLAAPSRQPVNPTLAQETKLTINGRTGSNQEQFEALIALYRESHPDVSIEGQYFSGANQEYFQKLAVLFAGGTEADIVFLTSIEGYYDYAARGQLLNLDDLIARDAVDLSEWFAAAIEMDKVDGSTYALPLWAHPSIVGLYYNQDLLDAAGIGTPDDTWTLDTLLDNAEALTKRQGRAVEQFGLSPAHEYFNGLTQLVDSYGGDALSEDGTTLTLDSEESRAAVQWLADAFQGRSVSPLPGQQDRAQLMSSQKIALYAGGYWERWSARTAWEFNWGVVPMPVGPAGTNGPTLQTDMLPISAHSDQQDAAWEFHKFLSSKEAGLKMYELNAIPSARADVWSDPILTADETHAIWAPLMDAAGPLRYPANLRLREFEINVNQELSNIWLGNKDVDQGIADTISSTQKILDQPRG